MEGIVSSLFCTLPLPPAVSTMMRRYTGESKNRSFCAGGEGKGHHRKG